MTKNNQLDFFLETDTLCKCKKTRHALTKADFDYHIEQVRRIGKLMQAHGWNLASNYYFHLDKLDGRCNAWHVANDKYLIMRAEYQEKVDEITLPVERNRY